MRVIIDTNVLISAVLKGRKPREIIEFVSEQANIEKMLSFLPVPLLLKLTS